MTDKLVPYQLPKDNPSPRRVIWAMQPTMVAHESEAVQDMSLQHPAMWRFVNHAAHDPYGYPTGFEIMPGITAASLLPDSEWPQKRPAFPLISCGSPLTIHQNSLHRVSICWVARVKTVCRGG